MYMYILHSSVYIVELCILLYAGCVALQLILLSISRSLPRVGFHISWPQVSGFYCNWYTLYTVDILSILLIYYLYCWYTIYTVDILYLYCWRYASTGISRWPLLPCCWWMWWIPDNWFLYFRLCSIFLCEYISAWISTNHVLSITLLY